ncbi:MAG: hypothetical protein IJ042_00230 [Butyricicoccus sp.]|nr:hypothetical protein [Butyricicoccus sp.]
MSQIKIVSFTLTGAATGKRLAELLEGTLVEQYQRGEDASLASSSLASFAQQAMVDCDLIIFVGDPDAVRSTVEPYIADHGYDPGVICMEEHASHIVQILNSRNASFNELVEQLVPKLQVPFVGGKD